MGKLPLFLLVLTLPVFGENLLGSQGRESRVLDEAYETIDQSKKDREKFKEIYRGRELASEEEGEEESEFREDFKEMMDGMEEY